MEGRCRFAVLPSPQGVLAPAALLCAQRARTQSSSPQTPMKDCRWVQALEDWGLAQLAGHREPQARCGMAQLC